MDETKGQRDAIARGNACRSPLDSGITQASSRFPQKPAESGQNPAQSGSSRKAASTARIRGKRFVEHHALPPEWWKMGPVMAIVMQGNALSSASFPKLPAVVFCLLAIILVLVSQVASRKEQEREVGRETASAFVGGFIGLPMLLFGTGMGLWFSQDNMIGAEVATLDRCTASRVGLQGRNPGRGRCGGGRMQPVVLAAPARSAGLEPRRPIELGSARRGAIGR